MPTKPDTSRQAPRWKPLSPVQEAALTLYLAGHSDTEVAAAVGVTRQTCNAWRHRHVVFMAELEQRRADLWRASAERLRSGVTKAIANLLGAVEAGDLKASVALLKAADLYGHGAGRARGGPTEHPAGHGGAPRHGGLAPAAGGNRSRTPGYLHPGRAP